MKRILAVAAGLLVSTSAFAAPMITIDDFNKAQTVIDTTATGAESDTTNYTIGTNAFTRTLIVDQTTSNNGLRSMGVIGGGEFNLVNDPGTNSKMTLRYNIDSLIDDTAGAASELMLSVKFFDYAMKAPFRLEGMLNGSAIGSETFTSAIDESTAVMFKMPALRSSGNTLELMFSGGTAFDATLGPIRIEVGEGGGIPVPEPGALGLLGLGIASVAFARRRKVAA